VKLEVSKKKTYLAISRRVNPYSPNTSFLAIFNSQKFVPSDGAFKLFKVEEEKYAKILCLSFNSIHYLIQFFRNKEETTGQYSTIRSDDLVLIDIINPEKLSEQEIQTLLTLFEKIKNVEFPSLMEQLQKRFWARVELDKTILKVLGLTDREIDEWLPKIYDTLIEEMRVMRDAR